AGQRRLDPEEVLSVFVRLDWLAGGDRSDDRQAKEARGARVVWPANDLESTSLVRNASKVALLFEGGDVGEGRGGRNAPHGNADLLQRWRDVIIVNVARDVGEHCSLPLGQPTVHAHLP